MVARKLHKLVAEHPTLLRGGGGSGGGSGGGGGHHPHSHSRPLLVILDRNADLITPLQHTSTYQALIDDVLQHAANRVEFQQVVDGSSAATQNNSSSKGNSKGPKSVLKRYDLDPDDDPFYRAQKFRPFPEAIEGNGSDLQEVTAREQEIRSASASKGSAASAVRFDSAGRSLASAVDSLPALLDRKKQLEVHTSILQAVMNEVAARDIPQYYELESALATGAYKNDPAKAKRDVMNLIIGGIGDDTAIAKGSVDDKLRLAIVWLLATGARSADVEEVTACLQESVQSHPGSTAEDNHRLVAGLRAFSYLKQLRSMQMIPSAGDMLQTLQTPTSSSSSGGRGHGATESALSSFMAKATTQATGLLAKATDKVISSMLGRIHKTHATQVLENLCEFKAEDESFLYLDPKVKGDVDVTKLRAAASSDGHRAPIHRAVVFVIGGGCYGEYQNLQLIASGGGGSGGGDAIGGGGSGRRRQVAYGSTEIVNSATFLRQLGQLGG
jgi:sec1 family domain-containing protein 1